MIEIKQMVPRRREGGDALQGSVAAASKVSAWAMQMTHVRAARTFIETCEAEGIPVLPVKGIVTAFTLYDDPVRRHLRDVDVRVPRNAFQRLGTLGRRLGWTFAETKPSYRNYVFDFGGVEVDVECDVGPPHVCALTVEEMIERSTWSTALGFRSRLPEFYDHLVLQMVNVFKDKLVLAREGALEDLEILARDARLDVTTVAARLRAARVAALGWVVADWMACRDEGARWGELCDALEPLRRPLYARALAWTRSRPGGLASTVLARAASDDLVSRARAVYAMARWRYTETD